jgi:hypothetical protein
MRSGQDPAFAKSGGGKISANKQHATSALRWRRLLLMPFRRAGDGAALQTMMEEKAM